MARTNTRKKQTSSTVPDKTILINCMTPCSYCEALAPCVDKAFKAAMKERGYAVTYNKDNSKCGSYYKTYGKLAGITGATPQVYCVLAQNIVSGVTMRPYKYVGDYKIPGTKKWDSEMLVAVCAQLIDMAEEKA